MAINRCIRRALIKTLRETLSNIRINNFMQFMYRLARTLTHTVILEKRHIINWLVI